MAIIFGLIVLVVLFWLVGVWVWRAPGVEMPGPAREARFAGRRVVLDTAGRERAQLARIARLREQLEAEKKRVEDAEKELALRGETVTELWRKVMTRGQRILELELEVKRLGGGGATGQGGLAT